MSGSAMGSAVIEGGTPSSSGGGGSGGDGCPCGITDSFSRGVFHAWGVADCGLSWTSPYNDDGSSRLSVDLFTGRGVMRVAQAESKFDSHADLLGVGQLTFDGTFTVQFSHAPVLADPNNVTGEIFGVYLPIGVYIEFGRDVNAGGAAYAYTEMGLGLEFTAHHSTDWTQVNTIRIVSDESRLLKVYVNGALVLAPGSASTSNQYKFGFQLQQYSGTEPLFAYIDDLDIVGVDLCSHAQFDHFDNRTTASGTWGTAVPSLTNWFPSGPGGFTKKKVEDGYAKIEQGPGFTGGQTGMRTIASDSPAVGEYFRKSTFDFLCRFKLEASTIVVDHAQTFRFDQNVSPFGGCGFGFSRNAGGAREITLYWVISVPFLSSSVSTPFTTTVGLHYWCRYERTESTHRVKFWADNEPEPSAWMLEHSGIPAFVPDTLEVFHQVSGTGFADDFKVWYDFIDIRSADSPCYIDEETGEPVEAGTATGPIASFSGG